MLYNEIQNLSAITESQEPAIEEARRAIESLGGTLAYLNRNVRHIETVNITTHSDSFPVDEARAKLKKIFCYSVNVEIETALMSPIDILEIQDSRD
jgi:hypothetical protein